MIRVGVWVHPGARQSNVGGSHDGDLVVRVRARAIEGAATKEASALLADAFNVRPGAVLCVRGRHTRTKLFTIEGDDEALARRHDELLLAP